MFIINSDIYWINPGSGESIPAAAHLHPRSDPSLHQQKDRRDAATHLRHCRQLLLQHAKKQEGPVLHHQVNKSLRSSIRISVLLLFSTHDPVDHVACSAVSLELERQRAPSSSCSSWQL